MTQLSDKLGYNPADIPRELTKHYISATDSEIESMLEFVGKNNTSELFDSINSNVKFSEDMGLDSTPEYESLVNNIENVANKNIIPLNFLGDGLPQYKVHEIVPFVCNLRGLTTAYTPYQPERSQGTLHTLWIYSSALAQLTGFEAVNASMYDRSTCLFEALKTGQRLAKKKNSVLVAESIYPQDKDVLLTLAKHTDIKILFAPIHKDTGLIDLDATESIIKNNEDISTFAFPQVNGLGLIEDVDGLTDLAKDNGLYTIAIIDPMLLAKDGLMPPSEYGRDNTGTTMLVGEGQHLTLDANFGGPGLGIFAIRFHKEFKNGIRATPGRYVGKAIDSNGKDCLCMVLSTREQHIRREKATSNICSNQSFVASIAGAAMIAHGDEGLGLKASRSRQCAKIFLNGVSDLDGVELAFAAPFFNEVVLKLSFPKQETKTFDLIAGKDISGRYGIEGNLFKISFSDIHSDTEIDILIKAFRDSFEASDNNFDIPEIPETFIRKTSSGLKSFSTEELKKFYTELADMNVSPDDDIYPLGSCTMKYNPHVNDWAASLEKFTKTHPDMPEECVQGNLELLYEIQEDFKKITGLPGLTGQPVAGAQGELVGIKLFQAYHEEKGNKKDLILIPKSAHGTNPATAAMAGYMPGNVDGKQVGIYTLSADERGQINLKELQDIIAFDGERIAGIMITNPNTSGVFEENFKEIADLIHSVDGLVYMDGANMNAIAGHIHLGKLGVDAVHNNLHKTWTIPHGGGGPGDAIVAVSEKLIPFLPGKQIRKNNDGSYSTFRAEKSIGNFHRHDGNFAHKVRAYAYIKALGEEGVKRMSDIAVLSANYLFERLNKTFPTLPYGSEKTARMHEFIITITEETFSHLAAHGTPRPQAISRIGKLFLDFGLHAPTVAFPEAFGLMIEPTESFTKDELDRFSEVVEAIGKMIKEVPEVLTTTPHFTPVGKVDEVWANKTLQLSDDIIELPQIPKDEITPKMLRNKSIEEIINLIIEAHKNKI